MQLTSSGLASRRSPPWLCCWDSLQALMDIYRFFFFCQEWRLFGLLLWHEERSTCHWTKDIRWVFCYGISMRTRACLRGPGSLRGCVVPQRSGRTVVCKWTESLHFRYYSKPRTKIFFPRGESKVLWILNIFANGGNVARLRTGNRST